MLITSQDIGKSVMIWHPTEELGRHNGELVTIVEVGSNVVLLKRESGSSLVARTDGTIPVLGKRASFTIWYHI